MPCILQYVISVSTAFSWGFADQTKVFSFCLSKNLEALSKRLVEWGSKVKMRLSRICLILCVDKLLKSCLVKSWRSCCFYWPQLGLSELAGALHSFEEFEQSGLSQFILRNFTCLLIVDVWLSLIKCNFAVGINDPPA